MQQRTSGMRSVGTALAAAAACCLSVGTFAQSLGGAGGPDLGGAGGGDLSPGLGQPWSGADCLEISNAEIMCECVDGVVTGNYIYTFDLTNFSGVPVQYVLLPGGGTVPNIITLGALLPDGATTTLSITLVGAIANEEFCFPLVLADENVEECCSATVCVIPPECDCFQLNESSVECLDDGTDDFSFTLVLQNLTSDPVAHAFFFAPDGVTISPDYVEINPPLLTCESVAIKVVISGAAPGAPLCFTASAHDENLVECCSEEICLVTPECSLPLPGDFCEDRLDILEGDTDYDTTGYNTDGVAHVDICQFDGQTYNDIWFNFVAPMDGALLVSTCGQAGYDTDLAVYAGCDVCPPGDAELIDCNDDFPGCGGFTSQVVIEVVAGECYKIRVGGWQEDDAGPGTLTVEYLPPPATGACCVGVDCIVTTADDCSNQGGVYQGDDVACEPGLCEVAPVCGPGAGPCDVPNGTPGCEDVACCEAICAADPFCCDIEWDGICAGAAESEPACAEDPGPCNPDAGPCDVPNGTPGCADPICCELICSQDAFCCEIEWDQTCADAALEQCSEPCACPPDALIEPEACGDDVNGGCNSSPAAFTAAACGDTWCGTAWADGTRDTDWYLVDHPGGTLSAVLTSEFTGVVFIVDGIAACAPVVAGSGDSSDCVPGAPAIADLPPGEYVVFVATAAFDGAPCGTTNDYVLEISCSAAATACAGDLDNDGLVGAADLAILVSQWGQSGAADLTIDGVVNNADLVVLLEDWGCDG